MFQRNDICEWECVRAKKSDYIDVTGQYGGMRMNYSVYKLNDKYNND